MATLTHDTTIDYLEWAAACRITIPAGTRVKFITKGRVGWVVDDVALLVRLTGNAHDPKYRYAWLPDDVAVTV